MTTTDSPSSITTSPHLRIVPMTMAHLPGALRLSQETGWPHRPEDWALSLSISLGVVALQGDTVVGTALCTPFGPVASLNMIIVDTQVRGQGLGRKLVAKLMTLAEDREQRLVATPEGRPLYEKLGFAATGEIHQHQGIAIPAAPAVPVRSGSAADIDLLVRMDKAASGMERRGLLRRIAGHGGVLLAEDGFALMRTFGQGYVVGPVVAGNDNTARALIATAADRVAGSFLRIDLPKAREFGEFITALGLSCVNSGTAMTFRPVAGAPGDFTTYALASQALG